MNPLHAVLTELISIAETVAVVIIASVCVIIVSTNIVGIHIVSISISTIVKY